MYILNASFTEILGFSVRKKLINFYAVFNTQKLFPDFLLVLF